MVIGMTKKKSFQILPNHTVIPMSVIIQLVFKIQVKGRCNQCLYILIHPMETLKRSLTVFKVHSRHSCVTILPDFCQQNFSPGTRQEFPYSHELGFARQKESFPVQGVSIGYSAGSRARLCSCVIQRNLHTPASSCSKG